MFAVRKDGAAAGDYIFDYIIKQIVLKGPHINLRHASANHMEQFPKFMSFKINIDRDNSEDFWGD